MSVEIRTFRMEDLHRARPLWEQAEGMSPPSRDEVVRKLERDAQLFLVAEDNDGDLVGVVMGTFDGRRGWIFRLAVDPRLRRRGIARQLIGELERRFLAMGVRHLRLLTLEGNDDGRAFWRAAGYEEFPGVVMFSKDVDEGGAGPSAC